MTSRIAQVQHHNVFKHSGSLDGRRKNVIRCEPHTVALKTFFFNSFVDFDSCRVVSFCDMRKKRSIKLRSRFDHFSCICNGGCFETALNLLNVSCCKMFTFRDFLHERKKTK